MGRWIFLSLFEKVSRVRLRFKFHPGKHCITVEVDQSLKQDSTMEVPYMCSTTKDNKFLRKSSWKYSSHHFAETHTHDADPKAKCALYKAPTYAKQE